MPNFLGSQPTEFNRFCGQVDQDSPDNLPIGVAGVCRNSKFSLTSVKTRYGTDLAIQSLANGQPSKQPITGLLGGIYTPQSEDEVFAQMPLIYDFGGNLQLEDPVGTGRTTPLTGPLVALPEKAHMIGTQGFNCAFLAFSDLITPKASMATLLLKTRKLDPYGMKPFGASWQPKKFYQAGEVVTPSLIDAEGNISQRPNGHTYVCIKPGTSAAVQPAWPLVMGATINDGPDLQWQEQTARVIAHAAGDVIQPPNSAPQLNRQTGAGAFPAGQDVYVALTYQNVNGETVLGPLASVVNTVLDDAVEVVVTSPDDRIITAVGVYEADVATGDPAPVAADFKLVGYFQSGDEPVISESAAGAAPPAVNSARIPANVSAGQRYMAIAYVNRLDTRSGIVRASTVAQVFQVDGDNSYLEVTGIPRGPENIQKRILGFTVANGSPSGPFFYIGESQVSEGMQMTSTVIDNNDDTSLIVNFTDIYLLGAQATSLTDRLRVIEPYPCVDAYFSPSFRRVFQCGVPGYLSGTVVSLADDVESYYRDTSPIPIGADDGQRTWCVREYKETLYALRERSGSVITVGDGDPATWAVNERWKGVGPCGPRAVDVGSKFMAFVHRSGVYIYTDTEPECVTKEIPKLWNTVNWLAATAIWVAIDEEEKEVHIGLPVGGSSVPNCELVINYEEGWANPIMFSRYSAREITIEACRKWSVNDISAFVAGRIERIVPGTPIPNEGPVGTEQGPVRALVSQFLYGSAAPDGAVLATTPGVYHDRGAGIDWQYETVSAGKMLAVCQAHGLNLSARGSGPLQVSLIGGRDMHTDFESEATSKELRLRAIDLAPDQFIGMSRMCPPKINERWRVRFTNGAQKDVWGEIKYACLFTKPIFSGRTVLEAK